MTQIWESQMQLRAVNGISIVEKDGRYCVLVSSTPPWAVGLLGFFIAVALCGAHCGASFLGALELLGCAAFGLVCFLVAGYGCRGKSDGPLLVVDKSTRRLSAPRFGVEVDAEEVVGFQARSEVIGESAPAKAFVLYLTVKGNEDGNQQVPILISWTDRLDSVSQYLTAFYQTAACVAPLSSGPGANAPEPDRQ